MTPGRYWSLGVALLFVNPAAGSPGSSIIGNWVTEDGNAIVGIFRCDTLYCGEIIWAQKDGIAGDSLHDIHNPDPGARNAPIIGLCILKHFKADDDGSWSDGSVYDPESGNTYRGTISIVDSLTLRLRGYRVLPLFGRTTIWTRAQVK
jgi:uncharacterized protein (DUF2147 family)